MKISHMIADRWRAANPIARVVAAVAVGILALCALGSLGNDATPASAPAQSPATATTAPDAGETAPALTVSQQNAVESANRYLSLTGFSRAKLIEQLAYEGYSTDDATAAVDSLGADWMLQAERCASNYLAITSFSRAGMITQLTYDGFTPEQAAHGADSVGLVG